jgi:hypothetical protein
VQREEGDAETHLDRLRGDGGSDVEGSGSSVVGESAEGETGSIGEGDVSASDLNRRYSSAHQGGR